MAVLNSWQKITRVIPGKPFGDARDGGSVTVNSDGNIRDTASGSATSTALTVGSAGTFGNGDIFVIHQTQGTGVGQWEVNRVASGGGSTSITCQVALHYTYGTGAQVINFGRFGAVTLGSFTVTAWNGTTGGVYVVCGQTSIGGSGTVNFAGIAGTQAVSSAAGGAGIGFRGGTGISNNGADAYQGEGTTGPGTTSTAANGNGGGGGNPTNDSNSGGAGGGGGYVSAGSKGDAYANGIAGDGGNSVGSTDLTSIFFGGAGGGGGRAASSDIGGGGGGGGILILIGKDIDISSATINGNGGAGGNSGGSYGYGGGGAGGSCLVVCKTAILGTNKATVTGGTRVTGSDGRIAVHHSGTVTGTTNPTFTDVSDTSLIEKASSFLFNLV